MTPVVAKVSHTGSATVIVPRKYAPTVSAIDTVHAITCLHMEFALVSEIISPLMKVDIVASAAAVAQKLSEKNCMIAFITYMFFIIF